MQRTTLIVLLCWPLSSCEAQGPPVTQDADVIDATSTPCTTSWYEVEGDIEHVGPGFYRAEFRALDDLRLVRVCAGILEPAAEIVVSLSLHPDPDTTVILGRSQVELGIACLTPDQGAFEDISLQAGGVYRADAFSEATPPTILVEVVSDSPDCDLDPLS